MAVPEHRFRAIGCEHVVLTTDTTTLPDAAGLTERMVADLDLAASRFRPDSELARITAAAAEDDVHVVVSPLLGSCVAAALHAADITDGLVDPTVGAAVIASGYDVDLAEVRRRSTLGSPNLLPANELRVPGWLSVGYDRLSRRLTLPRGVQLDLGATAKAHAADLVAARLASELRGGFLVNLGGDLAVSGLLPVGGWDVGVEDEVGRIRQVVISAGQAIATSSTRHRTWVTAGERRHHIVDPRTGRTAAAVWAQVTCAGIMALEANAASTAAIVLGQDAPAWLAGHGIPARLDAAAGPVVVTPGWPDPQRSAA